MGSVIKKQRSLKRIRINLPVIYTYSDEHKLTENKGTTADISGSGIGFYTDKPLRTGLRLDVKIPHIWDNTRTCVVRWNSMKSPGCFRIGASLL